MESMSNEQPDAIPHGLEPRKQAIVGAQWIITIQLEVAEGEEKETAKDAKNAPEGRALAKRAVPVGEPISLRYGDSFLAKDPRNVGYLIARCMQERAVILKPKKKRATK